MSKLINKEMLNYLSQNLYNKSKSYTDQKVQDLNVNAMQEQITQLVEANGQQDAKIQGNTEKVTALESKVGVKTDGVLPSTGLYKEIEDANTVTLDDAKKYTDEQVAGLVDSAPEALNTLNELATAIQNNKDVFDGYVGTVSAQLDTKVDKVDGSRLVSEEEIAKFEAKAETADVTNALDEAKKYTDEQIKTIDNSALTGRLDALEATVGTKGVDVESTGLIKEIEDLKAKDTTQQGKIDTLEGAINILNGGVGVEGSVDKKIQDALNQVSTGAETKTIIQETVNTLNAELTSTHLNITLGGNDGVTARTVSLDLITTSDIDDIVSSLT